MDPAVRQLPLILMNTTASSSLQRSKNGQYIPDSRSSPPDRASMRGVRNRIRHLCANTAAVPCNGAQNRSRPDSACQPRHSFFVGGASVNAGAVLFRNRGLRIGQIRRGRDVEPLPAHTRPWRWLCKSPIIATGSSPTASVRPRTEAARRRTRRAVTCQPVSARPPSVWCPNALWRQGSRE